MRNTSAYSARRVTYTDASALSATNMKNTKNSTTGMFKLSGTITKSRLIVVCLGVLFPLTLFIFAVVGRLNTLAASLSRRRAPLSYWRLLHFSLYFLCGMIFPLEGWTFIVLGFAWELYEAMTCIVSQDQTDWSPEGLSGHTIDILCNITGFCCGAYVSIGMYLGVHVLQLVFVCTTPHISE